MSAGIQAVEVMATEDPRTVEESFFKDYFTKFSKNFVDPDKLARAKSICHFGTTITIATTDDVEEMEVPGYCIYATERRRVIKVETGRAGTTSVLKLRKIYPGIEERYKRKLLYKELLITQYVQRCEEEIRQNKRDRFIATCKPYWYMFNSYHGFELEYFPEGSLAQMPSTLLHDNERLGLLRYAAQGLQFLNSLGIMHSDVKTSNFCVSMRANGTRIAKLIDLGSAKFEGEFINRCHMDETSAYRPPELFPRLDLAHTGHDWVMVNPSADSWRFGLCILEVMTRRSFHSLWSEATQQDELYKEFILVNGLMKSRSYIEPHKFIGLSTSSLPRCANKLIFYLIRHKAAERVNMDQVVKEINEHLGLAQNVIASSIAEH